MMDKADQLTHGRVQPISRAVAAVILVLQLWLIVLLAEGGVRTMDDIVIAGWLAFSCFLIAFSVPWGRIAFLPAAMVQIMFYGLLAAIDFVGGLVADAPTSRVLFSDTALLTLIALLDIVAVIVFVVKFRQSPKARHGRH